MESVFYQSIVIITNMKIILHFLIFCLFMVIGVFLFLVFFNKKRARMVSLIEQIPGPVALPILGNSIEMNVDHDELFTRMTGLQKLWAARNGICRAWQGRDPYVLLFEPETVEPILSSSKFIDKSQDYLYLQPWLGTGLLTSFGKKWHSRRKILTPAFHFKILDDFLEVFNEQSGVLLSKLEREVDNGPFNIFPYVTLCTLDIVCETAMGRKIHAQNNKESDYVKAVYGIGEIIQNRQANILLQWDTVFRITKNYNVHKKYIKILHEFSDRVIRERKEEISYDKLNNNLNNNNENVSNAYDDLGKKKRLAFLDLLIEASKDGTILSTEDIREEVDTFMFEGHDTTSAAISWTLFLLGSDPKIQEKVVEEMNNIFKEDKNRPATMKDLAEMKYLECCIKDALRLYPSVPMMARSVKEDVQIGKYLIPAGTTALIMTYMLHRNPKIFSNPERFNPDNFLPENCHSRHAFSYIPFSAGPRNCIGQKFAILEEKSVISSIVRKYKIEAVDRREELTLLGELILRPKNGLKVKLCKRD